ncbi:hypothetical protein RKD48_001997 [Streptomyces ambofaciens]
MTDSSNFLAYTDDKSVKWHALRGVDLAGLESILTSGLPHTFQDAQGGVNLSLSGSPAEDLELGRDMSSFLQYTMDPSCLSVAVRDPSASHRPYRFEDEYASTAGIDPSAVLGVAAHDRTLVSPLSGTYPVFESMRSARWLDYRQRNIAWTARTCGRSAADELTQQLEHYRAIIEGGSELSTTEFAKAQRVILGTYASHLRTQTGREPTVADAVNDVMRRSGVTVPVLTWDDEVKKSMQSKNTQIRMARRSMYAMSPYSGAMGMAGGTRPGPSAFHSQQSWHQRPGQGGGPLGRR